MKKLIKALDRIESKLIELAERVGSEFKKAIDSRIELEQVKREMESWKNSSKYYREMAEKRLAETDELKNRVDTLRRSGKKLNKDYQA